MSSAATTTGSVRQCPECGSGGAGVTDSRDQRGRLKRTRRCEKCKHRWNTVEVHEAVWATRRKAMASIDEACTKAATAAMVLHAVRQTIQELDQVQTDEDEEPPADRMSRIG